MAQASIYAVPPPQSQPPSAVYVSSSPPSSQGVVAGAPTCTPVYAPAAASSSSSSPPPPSPPAKEASSVQIAGTKALADCRKEQSTYKTWTLILGIILAILVLTFIILFFAGAITSNSESSDDSVSAAPPPQGQNVLVQPYINPQVQAVSVPAPPSSESCGNFLRSGNPITVCNNGFCQTLSVDPSYPGGVAGSIGVQTRNNRNYTVTAASSSDGFQTTWRIVGSDGAQYTIFINEDGSVFRTRNGVTIDHLSAGSYY